MKDFENELDMIRLDLYEKTKKMDKEEIIKNVNSHAKKIAQVFGINIINKSKEEYVKTKA